LKQITIISNNNSIRLRFTHDDQRYSFSTGGTYGNPVDMGKAQLLAQRIALDIAAESFDPSLAAYGITKRSKKVQATLTLQELWQRFLAYKTPQCSPSTMRLQYRTYSGYMGRLPTHDLKRANEIREWVLQNIPIESAKRFMVRLSACCDWAVGADLIKVNPFIGMAKGIKRPKSMSGADEINPFTVEERDRILAAMKHDHFCSKYARVKHSFYYPLCFFLSHTGARFSEVAGLQWKHIKPDFKSVLFEQAAIDSNQGVILKAGLKTQAQRVFPCNERMRLFLKELKPADATPNQMVFPSPEGCYLVARNYRNRVWKPILDGLGIEYRKPYQTRHTFITLMLENGLDAKDVARLVGNSPEVIYRHYAGNKKDLCVPEV
jgi:integrase